jgi:hypothetical protein
VLCIVLYQTQRASLEQEARSTAQATTDFITALIALANPRVNDPTHFSGLTLLEEASQRLETHKIRDPGAAAELHASLGNAAAS